MRRLGVALLLGALLLAPAGCKKKRRGPAAVPDDGMLATMVQASDPHAAAQFTKGFYPVEAGSWRWTAGNFSVALRTPKNAPQNGARLILKFVIPDPVMLQLHSIKLSSVVNGLALPPEEYTSTGPQTYRRDVPAAALKADVVNVDFALDKFLPSSPTDQRELGVIAKTVGFEAK